MNEVESLRQEVADLQERLSLQAGQIETLFESVWAANVMAGLLPRLVPAEQAWQAAQTLLAELELVSPEQRSSRSGQWLDSVQQALLKQSSVPARRS